MKDGPSRFLRETRIPKGADASASLRQLLVQGLEGGVFDAVIVPMRVPSGDGYAHILTKDIELVRRSTPVPPIIPISGAKVLKSLTRRGRMGQRVAMILRPCEMRATLELSKLGQVDLTNVITITMDCPGALPLSRFAKDPGTELNKFVQAEREGEEMELRPICRICVDRSLTSADLHLGLWEGEIDTVPLIVVTEKGGKVLSELGLTISDDISLWQGRMESFLAVQREKREGWRRSFAPLIEGPDHFLRVLMNCINCHNCMRVCPVCYCRVCLFDSERLKHGITDYLEQAKRKGALRLPPDMPLFHLGRMNHMSLTCVSCGACEDACPASIPIAQIFSFVAEKTQGKFGYRPGYDIDKPIPLIVFREEELEDDRYD